jgi:hypothetical protein
MHDPEHKDVLILPAFISPYRRYSIEVYIYAVARHLSGLSMRKTAKEVGMLIGKPLMRSLAFPPTQTVQETFASYGFPTNKPTHLIRLSTVYLPYDRKLLNSKLLTFLET